MKHFLKYVASLILTIFLRVLQFSFQGLAYFAVFPFLLPLSKVFGSKNGFIFGALSMVVYDVVTFQLGWWTILTATFMGLTGALAVFFFKRFKKVSRKHYVGFAIIGTLFFDAFTAVIFGYMFNQTLMQTILGQIPFTAAHLVANVILVGLFAPLIEKFIVTNPKLELDFSRFAVKH